ncbi:MAG: hypothetical protein IPP29_25170 [Bacteroidetes bacterium]|nr:hypothetical protein [Bacteroidota bacterium]
MKNIHNMGWSVGYNPSNTFNLLLDEIKLRLSVLLQTQNQIMMLVKNANDSLLDEANTLNITIAPNEIPEINQRFINDVELNYRDVGKDYIKNNFNDLLALAQQCPYSGGEAVIRARIFLRQITDTIEYEDQAVCLQNGIFRQSNLSNEKVEAANKLILIPNPANEYIALRGLDRLIDCYSIQLYDSYMQNIKNIKFNFRDGQYIISIQNLPSGVYFIKANCNTDISFLKCTVIH